MTTATSQNSTEQLARAMAAYLPVTLVRAILQDEMPEPGHPVSLMAASIFADISGFTKMSEELASDGTRGAEELNRVLLITFTAMLDVIHDYGGAVSHFYGDAMSVYFPDEDGTAAHRALSCAQMMQRLMASSLGQVRTNRPFGKPALFDLTIKIGVGYGRCQEVIVGHPKQTMEFVLTGTAVDDAVEAEKQAQAGQVIASQAVLHRADMLCERPFQPYESDPTAHDPTPILNWQTQTYQQLLRLSEKATPFVPKAIYQRLRESGVAEIAEHRPVTSIFVQFQFAGDEDDSSTIETAQMGAQLQQYFQWASNVIRRFGAENGRLNRVLTGDKGNQLHIMFGAPVAPDAPEQALRCAMALLREQPEFVAYQKVGVAVGKVFAGPVGSTTRREYTVVGDVVNLSARLMQICPEGEVLTNKATADRARQWLEFEALPAQHLKGKQHTVTPHRMVADRSASSQIQSYVERWNRPLFGRDDELEELTHLLDEAFDGQGKILALTGSTGTGKSRLLSFGINHWLSKGGMGLLGVCLQHTSDIPYTPWRPIWRDFFGLFANMSLQEQVDFVVEQTLFLAPDSVDDVGLWADPLGLPIPQSEKLKALTAEARQARFFALVRRCFETAVSQQPIFIILEGLQYADASSLALLNELTTSIAEVPLMVGVSYRSEHDFEPAIIEHSHCHMMELADLSPKHARQILQQLVGTDSLPPQIEQQLGLRDRDGRDSPVNPLFLEESLNVMLGAGVLENNGSVRVHEELLNQIQLPDTIHGLLLARLDRLPPSERDLLQLASVIGRQFEVESLTALAETPSKTPLIEMLTDLTEADMTHLVTADPEWIYLFQHAMTHEVAYESLPYARRQSLHARVAEWMVEFHAENLRPYYPILAFHYSRASLHEPAMAFSLKAANDAKAIFANQESVDLYTMAERHLRALGIETHWETAVDLLLSRAEAQRLIGNFETAVQDAEQAEKIIKDKPKQNRYPAILNLLAELKCRQADFQSGEALALTVIEMLDDKEQLHELSKAYQWAGVASSSLRDYDKALFRLERAKELSDKIDNPERTARVLETMAFVHYLQKDLHKALEAMQQSAELSKAFNVPANVAAAFSNVALIQFQLGMPNDALRSIEQAIEFAQNVSRNFLATAYMNKAEMLTYIGDYDEAFHFFQQSLEMVTQMDDPQALLEVYLLYGFEYLLANNQLTEASTYFDEAQQLIEELSLADAEEEARWLIGKGAVSLAQQQLEAAKEALDQAVYLVDKNQYSWWRPIAHYYQATLLVHQSRLDEAQHHFAVAIEAIDNEGCPDYLPLIYLEMAKLEEGEARMEHLERSLAFAESRSKFHDKVSCLETAVLLLNNIGDEPALQKAKELQKKVAELVVRQTKIDR